MSNKIAWVMISRGSQPWNYIKAEGPCWKGEITLSLWLFSVTVGWQRRLNQGEV